MGRREKQVRYRFSFAVLGEGITEQWYLTHLKNLNGYNYSLRPKLFQDIGIEKAEGIIDELVSGGCDSIVFLTDYDTIVAQDKKDTFNKLIAKYKNNDTILICNSMPSIEYWFLLHFIHTTREFANCDQVIRDLKKYIKNYSKSTTYLKTDRWFNILMKKGGLEKAKANAKNGLEKYEAGDIGKHFPFTKMHLAIEEFEKQKNK